ncbi:MAG TPA: hypothetical protein VN203_18235, partial [Candidatus Acidoferrum sp.]|nr:hypothetical protein [Candidatus Acidoferrum sp.]
VEEAQKMAARSEEAAIQAGMPEYRGTALANRAWAMWRQGDFPQAAKMGQAAMEQWEKLPAGHASCAFEWTGLLPLLAIAASEDEVQLAVGYCRALLDPVRMRLKESLEESLEKAVCSWEVNQPDTARDELIRSVKLAEEFGYL